MMQDKGIESQEQFYQRFAAQFLCDIVTARNVLNRCRGNWDLAVACMKLANVYGFDPEYAAAKVVGVFG